MSTRSMSRTESGRLVYHSTFDQDTGTIMRMLPELDDVEAMGALLLSSSNEKTLSGYRMPSLCCPASPSPETLDVAITQKCGFGCSFCYQSSTPDQAHAPMELIESILTAFNEPPYQIAYGGGSPTTHPEFETILRLTRECGIVPNYTTEGASISKKLADVTNAYCGGVSMTFHSWKGEEWFERQYNKFDAKIHVHKNIHLIFDRDVVKNMRFLMGMQERMGKTLSVILLAYYPDVGRGTAELLPSYETLHYDFPEVCKQAIETGMKIAFSEGLLPYFLRRDLLDVSQAVASEGRYSCYISEYGAIRKSSFSKPDWSEAIHSVRRISDWSYELLRGQVQDFWNGSYKREHLPMFATLGSIVQHPSAEFQEYAKNAIFAAGSQLKWGVSDRNNPDTLRRFENFQKEEVQLLHGVDANKAWKMMRKDFTHDSGNDQYAQNIMGMGCLGCENEWRCSKEDTSKVHMLMCSTADFRR